MYAAPITMPSRWIHSKVRVACPRASGDGRGRGPHSLVPRDGTSLKDQCSEIQKLHRMNGWRGDEGVEGCGRRPHALRSSGTCHPNFSERPMFSLKYNSLRKRNGVGWHALDERVLRVRKGVEAFTELKIVGHR